jgi:hypothetical protein
MIRVSERAFDLARHFERSRMKRLLLSAVLTLLAGVVDVSAQGSPGRPVGGIAPMVDNTVVDVLSSSEQHFLRGEDCFKSGNMECARREFDVALDALVDTGIDVRSDPDLLLGWRNLIEKIGRYQTSAVSDLRADNWKTQEFEGRPVEEVPEPGALAEAEGPGGPLSVAVFQEKFEQLKSMFRQKFGRDFVVTGADHEEHRRLYGVGSAYDIRVHDLSPEQVAFVLMTGGRLGLHVKDFSSAEKVAAHNSRVISLGLPADTMASSVHIHIDRNTPYRGASGYITEPALKQSPAGSPAIRQ